MIKYDYEVCKFAKTQRVFVYYEIPEPFWCIENKSENSFCRFLYLTSLYLSEMRFLTIFKRNSLVFLPAL